VRRNIPRPREHEGLESLVLYYYYHYGKYGKCSYLVALRRNTMIENPQARERAPPPPLVCK
jgi:hypothetical protein